MEPIQDTQQVQDTATENVPWSVPDSDECMIRGAAYHPLGGAFLEDAADVSFAVEALLTPETSFGVDAPSSEYIYKVFTEMGVSRELASAMAPLLVGRQVTEIGHCGKAMQRIASAFVNGVLPDVKAESRIGDSPMTADAALRELVRQRSDPLVYVLPSMLTTYAKNLPSVHAYMRDGCMMLTAHNGSGINVKPLGAWKTADVENMLSFIRKIQPRVVSFPLALEQAIRAVYRISPFSWRNAELTLETTQQSLQRWKKEIPELLEKSGSNKGGLLPEVARLLAVFTAAAPVSVPEDIRKHDNIVLSACILLRASGRAGTLVRAFMDYLKVVPHCLEHVVRGGEVPVCERSEAIRDATQNGAKSLLPSHPLCDNVTSGHYGQETARFVEVAAVLVESGIADWRNDAVILTAGQVRYKLLDFGFHARDSTGAVADLSEFRALCRDYSTVVIDRGVGGGFNAPPYHTESVHSHVTALARVTACLAAIRPESIAVCGPLSLFEEIPMWLQPLLEGYTLKFARPAMGAVPMFWVYGQRGGETSRETAARLMRETLRDVQLCTLLRRTMWLYGMPAMDYRYFLWDQRPVPGAEEAYAGGYLFERFRQLFQLRNGAAVELYRLIRGKILAFKTSSRLERTVK